MILQYVLTTLQKLSADTSFNFKAQGDVCGGHSQHTARSMDVL